MRETEAGNTLEYLKRWIAFEEQFNKSLPMIPIYGNYYYDFYTANLKDYAIESNIAWSTAMNTAYLGE